LDKEIVAHVSNRHHEYVGEELTLFGVRWGSF